MILNEGDFVSRRCLPTLGDIFDCHNLAGGREWGGVLEAACGSRLRTLLNIPYTKELSGSKSAEVEKLWVKVFFKDFFSYVGRI